MIISHPFHTSAVAPFSAIFTCSARGYGQLKIVWHRSNFPISGKAYSVSKNFPDNTTSTLIIPSVGSKDTGEYYCVVWSNMKASQSKKAKLILAGKTLAYM